MSEAKRRPLLIIEDDLALQKQMRWAFDKHETVVASDGPSAIAQLRRHEPAVITMDLGLPPHPDDPTVGLELLQQILTFAPQCKVIVLTGQNDQTNALKAIRLGAYDFFAKPFDPELLENTIDRAYRVHELQEANERLRLAALSTSPLQGILSQDASMQQVCRTIEKIAPSSATAMLLGESGTGKELLARALHDLSPRRHERFVAINCAAIPETLLESELFGYEKGAFSGASKQTIGKIETADQGTLFLDEIGDLPLALQAKILRFLQERTIERIGGRSEIAVDVRIVCATHQNLRKMIEQSLFRSDLYFRLAEIVIEIPPLRNRPGDASLLAHAFVRKFAAEQNRGSLTLSPDAIDSIESFGWPGNIRELENCVKRAVIMAESNTIQSADLNLGDARRELTLNLRQVREEAERRAVARALGMANGNLSKAADALGISRPTMYELLDRFGLR